MDLFCNYSMLINIYYFNYRINGSIKVNEEKKRLEEKRNREIIKFNLIPQLTYKCI